MSEVAILTLTPHQFDPGRSLSFARELFETFELSYADTSLLTGWGITFYIYKIILPCKNKLHMIYFAIYR